jgi:soluble lytic murein transglycosylase-like protein
LPENQNYLKKDTEMKAAFNKMLILLLVVITIASISMMTEKKVAASSKPNPKVSANYHSEAGCEVSPSYPAAIRQWCSIISKYAKANRLDPDLVAAIILQESGGQNAAYSNSGAVGLMQVMPRDGIASKFQCTYGPCFSKRPTMDQLQDPDFNVSYGTSMIAGLNRKYGNIREALKNYGPIDMGYAYTDIVLRIYERYRR